MLFVPPPLDNPFKDKTDVTANKMGNQPQLQGGGETQILIICHCFWISLVCMEGAGVRAQHAGGKGWCRGPPCALAECDQNIVFELESCPRSSRALPARKNYLPPPLSQLKKEGKQQ